MSFTVIVLPANLFKNSLILVWCFFINLHAEISEPLQHYLLRLFLTRSSTTRESLLGASSFYLILFSTVLSVLYRLLNFEQICLSKYIKIFDNAVRKIKQNVGAELKPPIVKLNVDFQFMVHSLVEIELSLKW
jgi:hypothetical protein